METVYLKILQGSTRLRNYMGLQMNEGVVLKHAKTYLYVEVPIRGAVTEDSTPTTEVKRNQHVFIEAACTLDVKGNTIIEVEPNGELAAYGQVQAGYKLHPDSGKKCPGFWFTARKDTDLNQFSYAVRLYMLA